MERSGRHWYWDQMHFPRAVTPLTATTDLPCMVEGFTRAWEELSRPLVSTRAIVVNGYVYFADIPFEGTAEEQHRRERAFENEVSRRAATLLRDWRNEFLPQISEQIERLRVFDYGAASTAQILDLLHQAREMRRDQWRIHDLVVVPAVAVASQFVDLYASLFGPGREHEAGLLLQGFPNLSLEADRALWLLAQRARESGLAARVIATTAPEHALKTLQAAPEAAELLSALDAFLDRYGWRTDDFELADPTWREAPAAVLALIQRILDSGADDPLIHFEHAVAVRDRLTALAREQLSGDVGAWQRFVRALDRAQQYLPAQEDHNYPIDQYGRTVLRLPLLELGRRFVMAGVLDRPDDVFFLTVDEVSRYVMEGMREPQQQTVAIRKADWESWRRLSPPPYLGAPPPEPSPSGRRFWGATAEQPLAGPSLRGQPASAGRVTGTARVVLSLEEGSRLQPGDILVCRTTLPAWTALFGTVAAVVADSGGTLSHCAIVAREYGVPCVVGTRIGTIAIRDGQRITVDGTTGTVELG
jgi:pyruvate,water dikinase